MSDSGARYLDGNSAAGPLAGVFAVDLTAALGGCAGCGAVAVLAAARVYPDGPGLVVRCTSCESVLIRVVEAPQRTWLDLRGVAYLEVATGPEIATG